MPATDIPSLTPLLEDLANKIVSDYRSQDLSVSPIAYIFHFIPEEGYDDSTEEKGLMFPHDGINGWMLNDVTVTDHVVELRQAMQESWQVLLFWADLETDQYEFRFKSEAEAIKWNLLPFDENIIIDEFTDFPSNRDR